VHEVPAAMGLVVADSFEEVFIKRCRWLVQTLLVQRVLHVSEVHVAV